jgi:hypothetical protein
MAPCFSYVFVLASFLSAAFGNIVSPGLGKCLDLHAKLKDDKTRQTLEDMQKESVINVQLYKCHNQHNQEFEIVNSTIKSKSLEKCLTAAGEKADTTQNIQLETCNGSAKQKWDLIAENYVVHPDSGKCMDVQAAKKPDGSYEAFNEIKEHKAVNVQLYKCHDAEKTTRVNQLWEWAVVRDGVIGLWEMQDVAFFKSANPKHGVIGIGVVGMASCLAAGILLGRRMRTIPREDAEQGALRTAE